VLRVVQCFEVARWPEEHLTAIRPAHGYVSKDSEEESAVTSFTSIDNLGCGLTSCIISVDKPQKRNVGHRYRTWVESGQVAAPWLRS